MRVAKEVHSHSGRALIVQQGYDDSEVCLAITGSRGGLLAQIWLPRDEAAELGRALVRLYGE